MILLFLSLELYLVSLREEIQLFSKNNTSECKLYIASEFPCHGFPQNVLAFHVAEGASRPPLVKTTPF